MKHYAVLEKHGKLTVYTEFIENKAFANAPRTL